MLIIGAIICDKKYIGIEKRLKTDMPIRKKIILEKPYLLEDSELFETDIEYIILNEETPLFVPTTKIIRKYLSKIQKPNKNNVLNFKKRDHFKISS